MPSLTDLLATHLDVDAAQAGVVVTRSFRHVRLSLHRPGEGMWRWRQSGDTRRPITALVFTLEGAVGLESHGQVARDSEAGLVLESSHNSVVSWTEQSLGLVVWMPTDGVTESSSVPPPQAGVLSETDLVAACRAFAVSAVRGRGLHSAVTDYVMERLLVEMGFAILLERQGVQPLKGRPPKAIDQARALLLANRSQPDYGPADLARDMHVSVRHVQRTFAREGTSPALELRHMRVDLANGLISDERYEPLSLTEIARHAGFRTLGTMRRAFLDEGRVLNRPQITRDAR